MYMHAAMPILYMGAFDFKVLPSGVLRLEEHVEAETKLVS